MQPGEYQFNNINCIKINKFFIDDLYASALYYSKEKYILEILVPKSRFKQQESEEFNDYNELNITLGDRWAREFKDKIKRNKSRPLENCNYHIEINGIKIGDSMRSTICYRYEPDIIEENSSIIKNELGNDSQYISNNNSDIEACVNGILESVKSDEVLTKVSASGELNAIFEDEDFIDALTSQIADLPPVNMEDANDQDIWKSYNEEREIKERNFFARYRNNINIPENLKNQPMVIMNLIFKSRGAEHEELNNEKINEIKFIYESYFEPYLERVDMQLSLGEYNKAIKFPFKSLEEYKDKILIAGVVVNKDLENEAVKYINKNIPRGKSAVYIIYEIIDNEEIYPMFYAKEILEANKVELIGGEPIMLKSKGINGFNRYISFIGYVNHAVHVVDIELFSVVVKRKCGNEFLLL